MEIYTWGAVETALYLAGILATCAGVIVMTIVLRSGEKRNAPGEFQRRFDEAEGKRGDQNPPASGENLP